MAGNSSIDEFASDINVTPFVDVMLVLLIIFMVTAPMMTEGLDINLPVVKAAEVLPTEDDHMLLTVKRDGTVFLDEFPASRENLEPLLQQLAASSGKQVFLRADKDTPYGIVMEVMGKIREAGIGNLGMVAESSPSSLAAERSGQNSAPASAMATSQSAPGMP